MQKSWSYNFFMNSSIEAAISTASDWFDTEPKRVEQMIFELQHAIDDEDANSIIERRDEIKKILDDGRKIVEETVVSGSRLPEDRAAIAAELVNMIERFVNEKNDWLRFILQPEYPEGFEDGMGEGSDSVRSTPIPGTAFGKSAMY